MAAQCLGRLVRDTPKGVWLLPFENGGGVFHLPIRCEQIARNGDLCLECQVKEQKTEEKVKNITGTTIQGMLPSYLNGRVTEPIPFWSRLYDGAWYRLKMESGCSISGETMVKVKAAVLTAYDGVEAVEPEPMPGRARKVRAKKAAVAAAPVAAVPVAAAVAAVPVPQPLATKPRAPKRVVKPVTTAPTTSAPLAMVPKGKKELPVENVYTVEVKKIEVDGRSLFYNSEKEKLYDLKFKYIGRLKDGAVVAFPDSDAEV